jgi:hypothetical protein
MFSSELISSPSPLSSELISSPSPYPPLPPNEAVLKIIALFDNIANMKHDIAS